MRIQNNNQPSFGAIRLQSQSINQYNQLANEVLTSKAVKTEEGITFFNVPVTNYFFENPQKEKEALKTLMKLKVELSNLIKIPLKFSVEISRISDKTAREDVLRLRGELPTISSKKSVLA
jgi:hypothetical protein